jgi:hypothetical protein
MVEKRKDAYSDSKLAVAKGGGVDEGVDEREPGVLITSP